MIAASPRKVRARVLGEHSREMFSGKCCAKARVIEPGDPAYPLRGLRCVCAYIEFCPDHGTFHVGTHD